MPTTGRPSLTGEAGPGHRELTVTNVRVRKYSLSIMSLRCLVAGVKLRLVLTGVVVHVWESALSYGYLAGRILPGCSA